VDVVFMYIQTCMHTNSVLSPFHTAWARRWFCLESGLAALYGPAGDVIAAGDFGGRIHFLCAQTGETLLRPLRCDSAVRSVAYSPDGTKLAAGLDYPSNSVVVFNTQNNQQRWSLKNGSCVRSVQFSPSGDTVAAGCDSGTVQIIDVATAEVKRPLRGHSTVVRSVCFSSDG